MDQQQKLRYVPIYDDIGKIIDYTEVLFARNEQEISLLQLEIKKNKLAYDERLSKKLKDEKLQKEELNKVLQNEKKELEEWFKKTEENIESLNKKLIDYKKSIDDVLERLNRKVDSLKTAVDSLLKQELSISISKFKMPHGMEEKL